MRVEESGEDIDVSIINAIPVIDKPNIQRSFFDKLKITFCLGVLYGLLSQLKLVGAILITPAPSRFSLLMNLDDSIISTGRSAAMWSSFIVQLAIQQKFINIGNLGRRKESNITTKLTNFVGFILLILNSCVKIRELIYMPTKWWLPHASYFLYFLLFVQSVLGGLTVLLMDQISTVYGLPAVKYSLLIDASKIFYYWIKNYNNIELDTGFSPLFTLIYSLTIAILTIALYTKKYKVDLEYVSTGATYVHPVKLMLGDTQTLFVVSTFKEGVTKTISFFENVIGTPFTKTWYTIHAFLSSSEPYYTHYLNGTAHLILADLIYNGLIFFVVTGVWLNLTKVGGPDELIHQLNRAGLKPVGGRATLDAIKTRLSRPLYTLLSVGHFFLYLLILSGSIFPLVGPSNVGSFITYITVLIELVTLIHTHIPPNSFFSKVWSLCLIV